MSVTFRVGRGNRPGYLACPTCGADSPNYGDPDCQEIHPGSLYPCMGYGFTIEDTTFPELNVANTNAAAILAELLGRPDLADDRAGEGLCGELDPRAVLASLSVSDPSSVMRETRVVERVVLSEEGVGVATIYVCGVGSEQAARYATVLRAIAARALAEGVLITFD